MLIHRSILSKLSSIKLSDKDIYLNAISSFKLKDFVCPCCHAKGLGHFIAPYYRHMVSMKDGALADERIPVKRIECSSCVYAH